MSRLTQAILELEPPRSGGGEKKEALRKESGGEGDPKGEVARQREASVLHAGQLKLTQAHGALNGS